MEKSFVIQGSDQFFIVFKRLTEEENLKLLITPPFALFSNFDRR